MPRLDESQVYRWFELFKNNEQLTEVRLVANDGKNASGYFTNAQALIQAIKPYTDNYNVYFTVNRVNPECYGREQRDRIVMKPKNATTDSEIIGRDWVYIDFDAKRVSGSNATDYQVQKAKDKANEVYKFLLNNGFNEPIVVFSGNGVHFYLKCALKPTEENNAIIKRFIQAMGMLFTDENVDIDQKVFNLGRISRIPGSYSCKGSKNDLERPQRMCKIIKAPLEVNNNDIEYFKKIANMFPEEVKPSRENNYSSERFDLEAFIQKHNIPVIGKVQVPEGTKYYLEHCLFNENHRGKDAVLFQRNNGAVAYYCFHSSCCDNDWRKVRLMYEPNAYDKENPSYQYGDRRKVYQKREFKPIEKNDSKGEVWLKMSSVKKPKFNIQDYIPTGVKQIDDLIIGFKRKHVTVWSGYRGCAKTTFLNMIILNAANRGYKSALWTGELDSDEEKYWLYLQASGKTYNKSKGNGFFETPESVVDRIDSWIDKYFWLFNNEYGNNFNQIIDVVRKLKEKEDIDFVVFDNLMTLDIDDMDGDKNERQKNLMYSLTRLAKELNIHIHIVAHPNKSGTFLRPNNISGSGHIPDLAQNVFILHRISQDFQMNAKEFLSKKTLDDILLSSATNCIEICKCRDKGSAVDHFINLYFEIESNRLKNSIAENLHYGWEDQPVQQQISIQEGSASSPSGYVGDDGVYVTNIPPNYGFENTVEDGYPF